MAYLTRDLSETSSARNYVALRDVDRATNELRVKGVITDEGEDDEAEFRVFLEGLKKGMG